MVRVILTVPKNNNDKKKKTKNKTDDTSNDIREKGPVTDHVGIPTYSLIGV